MSRHEFHTHSSDGTAVCIQCGWDAPLGGFYLLVSREEDRYDYLFNNLDHSPSHPESFDVFSAILARMGIDLPPRMVHELYEDAETQIVNKYVIHHVIDCVYSRDDKFPGEVSARARAKQCL